MSSELSEHYTPKKERLFRTLNSSHLEFISIFLFTSWSLLIPHSSTKLLSQRKFIIPYAEKKHKIWRTGFGVGDCQLTQRASSFITFIGIFLIQIYIYIFQKSIKITKIIHISIRACFRLLWLWYTLKGDIQKFRRENLSRMAYKDNQVNLHHLQWWMLMHFTDWKKKSITHFYGQSILFLGQLKTQ